MRQGSHISVNHAYKREGEIFLPFMLKHNTKANHYRTTKKSLYPRVYPLFAEIPQTTPYRPSCFLRLRIMHTESS